MRSAQPTRATIAPFALAMAIALVAGACTYATGDKQETSPDRSFLDPIANEQEAQDLFVVEAEDAEYWRLFTFDTYDGDSWAGPDLDGREQGVSVSTPATLPQPPGATPPDAEILDQTFRIVSDIASRALPMAEAAEQIAGPLGDIKWDAARSQAFIETNLEAGTTYTVRSRIVVPTPEELDRVEYLAPSTYGRWTVLPTDLDPRIAEIAKEWTARASTDYRKVLAIQQRFQQDDFTYSTAVDTTIGDDALVEFLTRTRTGFCQHYSSAMAVMVRTLGLPSRIGVGFRAGTRQQDGSFMVTTNDAHVWVEVLFPGYGWLQFEPEHGTAHPNARPGTYLYS